MVCKGKRDIKVPLKLFRQLAASYPVYCGNGNHENRMVWERSLYGDLYEEYRDAMTAMGVSYLEDSCAFLGRDLRIAGLDLAPCFYGRPCTRRCRLCPRAIWNGNWAKDRLTARRSPSSYFWPIPLCILIPMPAGERI